MQTRLTTAPFCNCETSSPICFNCSICSGEIFGRLFVSGDCVVTSHKPGRILPAAKAGNASTSAPVNTASFLMTILSCKNGNDRMLTPEFRDDNRRPHIQQQVFFASF